MRVLTGFPVGGREREGDGLGFQVCEKVRKCVSYGMWFRVGERGDVVCEKEV